MSDNAWRPVGQCFYCAKYILEYQVQYVCPTVVGLVRLCREHAQQNSLARIRQERDVIVTAADIKGWKSGD